MLVPYDANISSLSPIRVCEEEEGISKAVYCMRLSIYLVRKDVYCMQGCPLARCCAFLFSKLLSTYLAMSEATLQGLMHQLLTQTILDIEFAYDIILYVKGSLENVNQGKSTLGTFYANSGEPLIGLSH